MSTSRAKLFLLPVIAVAAFALGTLVARQATKPEPAHAQTVADSPEACLANALTDYMNAVIDGAEGLSNIRLLSPAFNLTSGVEPVVYSYMVELGANFGGLYGFAGNTYSLRVDTNGDGNPELVRAMDWYQRNGWAAAFGARPVIFTEYGDFALEDPAEWGGREGVVRSMITDYNQAVDGGINGINYFAALTEDVPFNPDPAFAKHHLTADELHLITNQRNRRLAGLNQGIGVQSGAVQNRAEEIGFGWVTEIIFDPGGATVGAVADSVNAQPNVQTVIRMCIKDQPCPGFEDPDSLVQFLTALNSQIDRPVYVLAGPNEPASEPWIEGAEECGLTQEPEERFPFEIVDIPCSETYQSRGVNEGREFHSLRPYPASPCDRTYDENIQTYMCGQDLIAKQVYEVTRADCVVNPGTGQSCVCQPQADGSELCTFTVNSSVEVELDLTNAELPIAGNTEDVPNAESRNTGGLTFPQRVNEYVSWYLHGVPFKANEEPIDYLIPTANDLDLLINYSGPLKKLLPVEQYKYPYPQPDQTQVGLIEDQADLAGETRHNQIVICREGGPLGSRGPQIACYFTNIWRRVTEVVSLLAGNDFWYTPFSSTEDLVGRARTEPRSQSNQPGNGLGLDPNESTAELMPNAQGQIVNFTPTGQIDEFNRSYHSLYFAHMQEDTELAEYLQQTYLPEGMTGLDTNLPNTVDELLARSPYCEIVESRTNPGDSLHGDYINGRDNIAPETEQPSGIIEYTARFTCLFEPPPPLDDPTYAACIAACEEGAAGLPPGTVDCAADCAEDQICQKNVLIASNIQIFTPRATDLWSRLVMGTESVFRRMFPRVEEGAPIDEIEDIPAHSNVSYLASPLGGPDTLVGTEALAGDPERSRSGAAARLYFPHLGGIHEYFLQQIQIALRPYNLGSAIPPGGTPSRTGEALQHLFEPTCNGTVCYQYIIEQTVAQARCNGQYLNPYVAIAIALSENGGLISAEEDGSNVKHFGCDPFDRLGIGYSPVEKFECMINTFTNSCQAGRSEAEALASYGFSPAQDINQNLVSLLGLQQETGANGYNFDLWVDSATANLFANRLLSTLPGQQDLWFRYYEDIIEDYSQ